MSFESFLIVAAILFCIGLYGALARRNVLAVLMSIELMFNAVNITLVAMAKYLAPAGLQDDRASICGVYHYGGCCRDCFGTGDSLCDVPNRRNCGSVRSHPDAALITDICGLNSKKRQT